MGLPPLATTTTGSFPRPGWLVGNSESMNLKFRFDGELLREALDDATRMVLQEQAELGLDVVTDGELRRTSFIMHLAGAWEGVDLVTFGKKNVFRNKPGERSVPRVIGRIVRRASIMADEIRFIKAHSNRLLKVAVPGPMTVIDSTANEFYRDEETEAMDIAAAVNLELREMQAAGCDMLQIDEPAMTRYHDKVRDYGLRALDRCLEGVTIPTVVHLCYGYPGNGAPQHEYKYEILLPMLMESRIGGFTVEFGRSNFDPQVLSVCGDRLVLFGCIDPGDTPAPPVESIKSRVREALGYLKPDQILLTPDCGLMKINRELMRQKMHVMVAAARELREDL